MKTSNIFLITLSVLLAFIGHTQAEPTDNFCDRVTKTINRGTKGVQVYSLQKKLVSEGFLFDKQRTSYDTETVNSVKKFQKKYNLAQVGNVGPGTLSKMRSLWCSNNTSTPDPRLPTNSKAEILPDTAVTIEAGRLIRLHDKRICSFGSGKIDWGDGNIHILGSRIDERTCNEGFLNIYPKDGQYKIAISNESGKVLYEINKNITGSIQKNVSVDEFSSRQLAQNRFIFNWQTTGAKSCEIVFDKDNKTSVNTAGSQTFTANLGSIATISCADESGRTSTAWTTAGPDSSNPKHVIKQFNYLLGQHKIFVIWDTSENVKSCAIEGDPQTPVNGAAEFVSTDAEIELQCFSKTGEQESKRIFISKNFNFNKVIIDNFTSEKIGTNVLLRWNARNADRCALYGDLFNKFVGKPVEKDTGSITAYLPEGKSTIKLLCSTFNSSDESVLEVIR